MRHFVLNKSPYAVLWWFDCMHVRELTVIYSVWPIIGWGLANMTALRIMQVTAIMENLIIILLVLTVILGLFQSR